MVAVASAETVDMSVAVSGTSPKGTTREQGRFPEIGGGGGKLEEGGLAPASWSLGGAVGSWPGGGG